MPISVSQCMLDKYRDGTEHFRHVFECLFRPSVQKAGYRPVSPLAKGSDVIHAEIIRNLQTTEIVLCDLSCLNPNVFFELGIRVALNKPVCLVKDELAVKLPFDVTLLNHYEYRSSLESWQIEAEIAAIAEHLIHVVHQSVGQNALWKCFVSEGEREKSLSRTPAIATIKGTPIADMIQSLFPQGVFVVSLNHTVKGLLIGYTGELSAVDVAKIEHQTGAAFKTHVTLTEVV